MTELDNISKGIRPAVRRSMSGFVLSFICQISFDAFYHDVGDALLAFFGKQEIHIFLVILEEVLHQHRRAVGVFADIEVYHPVVAVARFLAHCHAFLFCHIRRDGIVTIQPFEPAYEKETVAGIAVTPEIFQLITIATAVK